MIRSKRPSTAGEEIACERPRPGHAIECGVDPAKTQRLHIDIGQHDRRRNSRPSSVDACRPPAPLPAPTSRMRRPFRPRLREFAFDHAGKAVGIGPEEHGIVLSRWEMPSGRRTARRASKSDTAAHRAAVGDEHARIRQREQDLVRQFSGRERTAPAKNGFEGGSACFFSRTNPAMCGRGDGASGANATAQRHQRTIGGRKSVVVPAAPLIGIKDRAWRQGIRHRSWKQIHGKVAFRTDNAVVSSSNLKRRTRGESSGRGLSFHPEDGRDGASRSRSIAKRIRRYCRFGGSLTKVACKSVVDVGRGDRRVRRGYAELVEVSHNVAGCVKPVH